MPKGVHSSTEFKKGHIGYFKGKKFSKVHRKNISKALSGRPSPNPFKKGHPQFLGTEKGQFKKGNKPTNYIDGQSIKRGIAKHRSLGYDSLNEPFEGSEGHHIDHQHVIFIPKELHRSVWHSLDKPETMEQINTKVICWLLGVIKTGGLDAPPP